MALVLLLTGCTDDKPLEEPSTATTESKPVMLIASGDTQGWLIPCGCTANQSGGLIRRATFVQQQSNNFATILCDVGGATDGAAPYQVERFKAILRGEKQMNYVAHNLGENELLVGPDELWKLQKETEITFVSANAKNNGQLLAEPFVVVDDPQYAQKVAIVGLVSAEFQTAEIQIDPPASALLNTLDQLPKDIDRIVVLAYLPVEELHSLAKQFPEVDVVIGGPTGQALRPEKVGQTWLLSATNKGKFLGQVTFAEQRANDEAQIVEVKADLANDDQQQDNLKQFRDFLKQRDFTAAESGFVPASLIGKSDAHFSGTQSCRECHSQTNAHWDTTGHSHAWETLQATGAHVDSYCQQCHTTGFGLSEGFASASTSPLRTQVGCESCHGPSSKHVANPKVATPWDASGRCLSCHDAENSPLFEFESYWERVYHEE